MNYEQSGHNNHDFDPIESPWSEAFSDCMHIAESINNGIEMDEFDRDLILNAKNILDGEVIAAIGKVYIPSIQVHPESIAVESVSAIDIYEGQFNDIVYIGTSDFSVPPGLYMSIDINDYSIATPFMSTDSLYLNALAPIAECGFQVTETLRIPSPEPDDLVAERIDMAVMGHDNTLDFKQLIEIFQESDLSDSQLEFYTSYLNELCDFEYMTCTTSTKVFIQGENSKIKYQESMYVDGAFCGFKTMSAKYEDSDEFHRELIIIIDEGAGQGVTGVPLGSIEEIIIQ